MTYPVQYNADGAPIDNRQSEDFAPGDPHSEDWDGEEAVPFPLAYSYPEDIPASDYAAGQEAADIEATLLSDLEAAATAFWTDLDSDEDATGRNGAQEYNPAPETNDSRFEFRWEPDPDELIGPEPRRTLIAFRPPRARKRSTAPANDAGPELRTVNFDVHATPDGAFADDLAARNKEFYDLLKRDSTARKVAMPPRTGRGPGFETIFPRAEPAQRRQRPAPARPAGSGLARQAAAAAILAVVVGAGIFVIAQQFSIPATSEDSTASLSGDDPADAPARLGAADEPAEAAAAAVPNHAEPVDDRPTAPISTVDPGTLTTPPLYESSGPAGESVDFSDPAPPAPEFATIPLRTGAKPAETEPAAPAETAIVPEEPAATPPTEPLSAAEDPPAEPAATEPPAKPQRESVATTSAPAAAKEPAGNTQMLQISAGAGKVNSSVNMRAGPDNDAKVVRVLRAGTPVEIVNSCKFWCEVIVGGDRGFVFQRFISRTGGSAQAEPTKLVPENTAAASLPEKSEVAPREEARGPLNLLNFGRPNN
jgi:uncharacterized protein YraI